MSDADRLDEALDLLDQSRRTPADFLGRSRASSRAAVLLFAFAGGSVIGLSIFLSTLAVADSPSLAVSLIVLWPLFLTAGSTAGLVIRLRQMGTRASWALWSAATVCTAGFLVSMIDDTHSALTLVLAALTVALWLGEVLLTARRLSWVLTVHLMARGIAASSLVQDDGWAAAV